MSGKDPQVQKSSLDSLDSFISENKNTNGLKELYAQVKSKLSPGKVTKLIEAFIGLRMLEEELSVSTGSDNDQDLSSSENDDRKSPRRTR